MTIVAFIAITILIKIGSLMGFALYALWDNYTYSRGVAGGKGKDIDTNGLGKL